LTAIGVARGSIFGAVVKAALPTLCAVIVVPSSGLAAAPAHRAEVQINLCSTPEEVVKALQLEPVGAERYDVWYFDTADMALFRKGTVVRLRIKAHAAAELTLKFADQNCSRVNRALLPAQQSKCEYDVRGALVTGAVSISKTLNEDQVRALMAKPGDLQALLSRGQIGFLRDGASAWPLPAPLLLLGPVRVQPYRQKGDRSVVEAWQFNSGKQLLELSQKTKLSNAHDLNVGLQARLTRHRVAICRDQGSPAGAKLQDLLGR
jgi:hypothetical protein